MATSNGHFPTNLPILTSKNYDRWSSQMRVIFGFQEAMEIVNDRVKELEKNPGDEHKAINRDQKKDCKALFLIQQCVDTDNREKIASATIAKEAWDNLARFYEGADKLKKVKLQTLSRRYEQLQMRDQESVSEFFTMLITLTNQMKSCGEKLSTVMIVEKVLRSLSPRFDHVVVTIEEAKDLEVMKVEELQATLEAHELRINERNAVKAIEHAQALQAQSYRRGANNKFKKGKDRWKNGKGKCSTNQSSNQETGVADQKHARNQSKKGGGFHSKKR